MKLKVEEIFIPSVGVDLVFDMDSLNPISRSSIIYDVEFNHRTVTLAQPIVPISPTSRFNELHLTTILNTGQRNLRAGVKCSPIQFIDQYRLANQSVTQALVVEYSLPAIETNIRAAFRLPLSRKHTIKAKILYNQTEYYTARDFKIRDISFAGMGLVIPRIKGKKNNPLLDIRLNTVLAIGMVLIHRDHEKPVGTFPVKTRVVRINTNYSESHILLGLKITAIRPESETLLNRFIHHAQIDELKRLSNRA